MKLNVIVLPGAEKDLIEIHTYLISNFSRKEWLSAYKKIKQVFLQLKSFPESGALLFELQRLNLPQYRQIMAGMNRLIYEIRSKIIYIHIICDARKELSAVLSRRLIHSY